MVRRLSVEDASSEHIPGRNAMGGSAIVAHPFVVRLKHYANLADADIDAIATAVERTLLIPEKKEIVVDGYQCATLHLVERGFGIRYKVLGNGKRQVLNVVLPGDIVGLPGAMFGRAFYSVISLTAMKLQMMSLDAFLKMGRAAPEVLLAMMWFAEDEVTTMADHLIGIGRLTALERVANFIYELWSRLHRVGYAIENSIELPISQRLIGDALGLSAPHVNRMLRRLKELNLIAIKQRSLIIKDAEELQLLGRYDPRVPMHLSISPG